MNAHRTLALLIASALVSAGCSGSTESSQTASTAASADATEVALANLAERQRTCIDALKAHLTALKVTRIDAFLGQTLNGLVICDATNGFSHLPTRDVSTWLNAADGKPHANVPVPDQPPRSRRYRTTAPVASAISNIASRGCIAISPRASPTTATTPIRPPPTSSTASRSATPWPA
jgi:ABC-type Fe3+-hydroxamate transport system substrate-binding protein